MKFRSATTSLILLLVTIVFFVLAICTAPLSKKIGLSKNDDVIFGTFGYCKGSNCSNTMVGYELDYLNNHASQGFRTTTTVRQKASYGLVLIPVSACICALATILLLFAYIGRISRSPGFFNFVASILFFNVFITAIAFVICVITFVPRIQWLSWLVLANAGIQFIVLLLLLIARRQAVKAQSKYIRRSHADSMAYNPYSLQNNSNLFSTSSRTGDLPKFADYSMEKPVYDTLPEYDGLSHKRGDSIKKLKPTLSGDSRSMSSYAPEPAPQSSGFRFPFMRSNKQNNAPENPFRDPENPFKDPPPNPWSIDDIKPPKNKVCSYL
ncbi:fungal protein [Schizosaccharomyces cryophilus OY26]|uniref:Fungal protein n=1 Tax=Schizosaccharomyces cryophilus (strain OY26 / ATCC MYA-4695 / CBS 11777 / NBRC 106824 / NRRL Y48691) TaxID=653667 RepID=S9XBL5_SCHCR|nr:uncharacterized protein SPOG_02373 [Schizosaccharomyces cryophilus OY26]EPY51196.1 fungal protein [Schizosaccharomyces cryophilus OY26]